MFISQSTCPTESKTTTTKTQLMTNLKKIKMILTQRYYKTYPYSLFDVLKCNENSPVYLGCRGQTRKIQQRTFLLLEISNGLSMINSI